MCGREVLSATYVIDFSTDRRSAMRRLWKDPEYRKKTMAGIDQHQRGSDKKKRKSTLRIGPEEISRAVASARRLNEKAKALAQQARQRKDPP